MRSAQTGHHYAGHSNRFWKLLSASGLVPRPLTAKDDARLPEWGLGLTNLVARPTPGVADLAKHEFEAGRRALLQKIRRWRPRVVALVGLTVFDHVCGRAARDAEQRTGLQDVRLAESAVFVLPNPSGRNAHYSDAAMLRLFRALSLCVASARRARD
jgi:TDG/mug DNA glycosylase family protein